MFRFKLLFGPLALALLLSAVAMPAHADSPNGIVTPADGDIISGTIGISGIADDPNFVAWQLDLLPNGDGQNALFMARGTNRVTAPGRIGRLETMNYPNGDYRLRLRVIRQDQNYSEYYANVTIANIYDFEPNGISSPLEGVPVACLVTIEGIAHADDFGKWQTDLLVGGSEQNVLSINHGTLPRQGVGTLGELDTTKIPDGVHMLRLRVVHSDSNYDTYYSRITINNSILKNAIEHNSCSCALPDPNVPSSDPSGVTNPAGDTIMRGTVPICGIANDPNFAAWELDLLFNADPGQSVMIGYGDSPQTTRAPFTMLDTTVFPDGRYALRLRIGRLDNTLEDRVIPVCIVNHTTAPQGKSESCASPTSK